MEVARVLGWLTIDDARVGTGRVVVRRVGFVEIDYHVAHRIGVLGEADGIFGFVLSKLAIEWLIVTKETAKGTKVGLSCVVIASDDSVVGALEEAILAVMHELRGGQRPSWG